MAKLDPKYIVIIVAVIFAALIIIILPPSILAAQRTNEVVYERVTARATISSADIVGTVTFAQDKPPNGPTIVTANIMLTSGESGNRGFHVHTFGLTGDNCLEAEGHYNPEGLNHGNREGSPRHIGDMGNIQFDNGIFNGMFEVPNLPLGGPKSIIGRTVVVHSQMDDLGQGGDEQSLITGNAGTRVGCAVITVVPNS